VSVNSCRCDRRSVPSAKHASRLGAPRAGQYLRGVLSVAVYGLEKHSICNKSRHGIAPPGPPHRDRDSSLRLRAHSPAPFLRHRAARIHALAEAKGYVVSIADLRDLEVELDISQNDFPKLAQAQSAAVALEAYPDRKYHAAIREISP